MPFDLQNLNTGKRFPYPLPDPKRDNKEGQSTKEWIEFRLVPSEIMEEIDDDTIEKREEYVQPKKKNGKPDYRKRMERVEFTIITKPKEREERIWDYMIPRWYLLDSNGEEIERTKEMIMKLKGGSTEFAVFAADCIEILTGDDEEQSEDLEKNGKSSAIE